MNATIVPVSGGAGETLADVHAANYRQLVGLAAVLGDRSGAEDVVQDAFVNVFGAWDRIRDTAHVERYLRSAVINGARRRRSRLDVRIRLVTLRQSDVDASDAPVLASERQRALLDGLAKLPARQRECLVLRFYSDLSEREIAETLGISAGSVKTHTHRGLESMAKEVGAQR